MKIYKVVNHVAFDHVNNNNTELQKAVANIIEKHQNNVAIRQKFNIQLVQQITQ